MITLCTSLLLGSELVEILGIILSILEAIIVILTLVSYFVPPDSKVGKKISTILVGLYKTKDFVNKIDQEINKNKEDKDDENRTT